MDYGEELLELQARIDGLQQMLAMLINSMPVNPSLAARILDLETEARKRGAHAGMIETLRAFRERLPADPKSSPA